MKIENPYLFQAYDVVLITDFVRNKNAPWEDAMFQFTTDALPFYDYVNYFLAPAGTPGSTYVVSLNGNDQVVSGITLHVPNLTTTGTNQAPTVLNQFWLQNDSLDVQLQVTIHGVQVYKLQKDQTQLTGGNAPPNAYVSKPLYAYGTDFIPTLTLTNINPAVPVASIFPNQGIIVTGNRYGLSMITDMGMAKDLFDKRRFSTITITPPRI
jgi:hypothetical protein